MDLSAAALFALCAIRLRGDQVIIGTAMTLLALGLTEVVYQRLFGITGIAQGVPAFQQINIPLLSRIPFLGRALFSHNILVYIAFLLVPCVYFFLYHTQQGLRVRACGEHPRAIAAAGANVLRLRTICLLFAGAMAGMAGGYLSLADVPYFTPGMTVGRGFIALAIVIFGKWHPVKACGAAPPFWARFGTRRAIPSVGLGGSLSGVFNVALCALFSGVGQGLSGAPKHPSRWGNLTEHRINFFVYASMPYGCLTEIKDLVGDMLLPLKGTTQANVKGSVRI